jgi:predicted transposase/invertase (TIGR01784 family)
MNNLHDKFVKERLQEKQNAIDFLKLSLPKDVLDLIDLDTIVPSKSTFVTDELKELFTDIIYNCKLNTTEKEAYCSILIEHKSYNDPLVAFQLNRYLSVAYESQIKNQEPFKVIIPLVFHHHQGKWKYRSIESYFEDLPKEFLRYLPKFDVIPFDVNTLSDETILGVRNVAISAMIMTQKHSHNPYELIDKMGKIYESLQTQEERNSFNKNFVYIMLLNKKENNIIEIFQKNKDKPINKVFMTLYEEITLNSENKGKIEGKIEIILNAFDQNVPIALIANITAMSESEVCDILKAHARKL